MRVELGGESLVRSLLDPICALYCEVFSAAPFSWRADEPELHRKRLSRLLDDATFGAAVALAGTDLVGFAYGVPIAPDPGRWSGLSEPLRAETTAEWPGRTFLLFDYAVRRTSRGKGIGKALHTVLLGSRPEERATLGVQPTAVETKRIYEHWGWRMVGQREGGPTAPAPVFDIYLRDSLDDLKAAQTPRR